MLRHKVQLVGLGDFFFFSFFFSFFFFFFLLVGAGDLETKNQEKEEEEALGSEVKQTTQGKFRPRGPETRGNVGAPGSEVQASRE